MTPARHQRKSPLNLLATGMRRCGAWTLARRVGPDPVAIGRNVAAGLAP